MERKLHQGVHKVRACGLSWGLVRIWDEQKTCQELDAVSTLQGPSAQGVWTQNTPTTMAEVLAGALAVWEPKQWGKAKGTILLQPWQKTKAKQQLGLLEWRLLYLQAEWLCVFWAH